jgi:hypothetical protein
MNDHHEKSRGNGADPVLAKGNHAGNSTPKDVEKCRRRLKLVALF